MQSRLVQFVFSVMLGCLAGSAWAQKMIYKCKNQEGALIYQKAPCQGNADTVTSWLPEQKVATPIEDTSVIEPGDDAKKKEDASVLKLKQNVSGNYFVEGSINDKPLSFVVDTGATFVSLPEAVAHGALIYCDDKIQIATANGVTDSCTAKISKLRFGQFEIKDVPAVIQPNLGQPLLGMNVLQSFKIEQNNGEMSISIADNAKTEAKK